MQRAKEWTALQTTFHTINIQQRNLASNRKSQRCLLATKKKKNWPKIPIGTEYVTAWTREALQKSRRSGMGASMSGQMSQKQEIGQRPTETGDQASTSRGSAESVAVTLPANLCEHSATRITSSASPVM